MTTTTDTGYQNDTAGELDQLRAENADLRARLAITASNAATPDKPVRNPYVISESESQDEARLATARAAAKRMGTRVQVVRADIPSPTSLTRLRRSKMADAVKVSVIAAYGRKTFMAIPWE